MPVSRYVSGPFSTEMGWVFAAIEIVSEDLKLYRRKNGFNGCSFISRLSLHHMQPTLSNTMATMTWEEAEEALVTLKCFINGSWFSSL